MEKMKSLPGKTRRLTMRINRNFLGKVQRKRKLSLTLIEVLIALSLSSIIMTAMFYFYQKAVRLDAEIQKVEERVFSLRLLQSRLMKIVPKAVSAKEAEKDFYFLTGYQDQISKRGTPYLLFSYDRGVDIEPQFSNIVLGRLYVDKKGRLMLVTVPAPSRWTQGALPLKREMLLRGVENIYFSFYNPPEKEHAPLKENKPRILRGVILEDPEVKGGFLKEWKNEYGMLPALVKIEIETKKDDVSERRTLSYILPYSRQAVVYDKGG